MHAAEDQEYEGKTTSADEVEENVKCQDATQDPASEVVGEPADTVATSRFEVVQSPAYGISTGQEPLEHEVSNSDVTTKL